jgi:eukaryotic-like serine/threonine-protein kinase
VVDGHNRRPGPSVHRDVTSDKADGSTGEPDPLPAGDLRGLPPGTILDGRYHLVSVAASHGPVVLWKGDDRILARAVAVRVIEHGPDTAKDAVDQKDIGDETGDQKDTDDPGDGSAGDGRVSDLDHAAGVLLSAAINSGRLVHPGAASTYDATTTTTPDGRVSYVVSEWVDGTSLTGMLTGGPLRPQRAASVVLAAARVIAAAHARGLCHGDLHPGDVIIAGHGAVKVIDLEVGAAVAALAGRAPDVTPQDVPDARARDLVGLGALLYAALTACWPLGADRGLPAPPTTADGRIPPPAEICPGLPADLETLAMATLGDDRAGRPTVTAVADFVSELERLAPSDDQFDTDAGQLDDTARVPPQVATATASQTRTGAPTRGGYATSAYGTHEDRRYDEPRYDDGRRRGYDANRRADAYADPRADPRAGDRGAGYDEYDADYGRPPAGPPGLGPRRGAPPPSHGRVRRQSRAIPLIAAITIIAVIAIVIIAINRNPGGGGGGAGPSASPSQQVTTSAPLIPSTVTDFDPTDDGGDGTENPTRVRLAVDGDPTTVWSTDQYYLDNQLGVQKKGVGLLLDFGRPVTPKTATVTFAGGPTSFQLLAGDAATPSRLSTYTAITPVTNGQVGQTTVTVSSGTPHRYWVLWLTHLPDINGRFQGQVAEVSFRS